MSMRGGPVLTALSAALIAAAALVPSPAAADDDDDEVFLREGDLTVAVPQPARGEEAVEITVGYPPTPPRPQALPGTPFEVTHKLSVVGSWMAPGEDWTSADLTADIEAFGACEVEVASEELPRLDHWEEADDTAFWDRITEPCFEDVRLGPQWLDDKGIVWGEEISTSGIVSFEVPVDEDLWVAIVDASSPDIDHDESVGTQVQGVLTWGGFAYEYPSGGYYGTSPPAVEIAAELALRAEPAPEPTPLETATGEQVTAEADVDAEGEAGGGVPAWAVAAGAAVALLAAGAAVAGWRRRRSG